MVRIRITAFRLSCLAQINGTGGQTATWSTGRNTSAGDIQVLAVYSTLEGQPGEADLLWRDSAHSIWRALAAPSDTRNKGPIAARFELVVQLDNPVPKQALLSAGLLKRAWPQSGAGKVLNTATEATKLAEILAERNPQQRGRIFEALVGPHPVPLLELGRPRC
jgi:hypothetical protein